MLMPHTGLLIGIAGISQHQGRSLSCKAVAVKVLMGGKGQLPMFVLVNYKLMIVEWQTD